MCVYTHISDSVETVYELTLLPNNTASEILLHKSGGWEGVCVVWTGYLSLRRRRGGDWENT